jgi:hypothetical protein
MTIHIDLPIDVEQRLLAEVRSGRHASLEEAILEKISHNDDADILAIIGNDADHLRRDLDAAWNDRDGAVDGENVFARIAAKSAALKAKTK